MAIKVTEELTGIERFLHSNYSKIDQNLSNISLGLFTDNKAATYPHPCRGYIMDAMFSFIYNDEDRYAATKIVRSFNGTHRGFYILSSYGHIDQYMDAILDLLHQIEDCFKFNHTIAVRVPNYAKKNGEPYLDVFKLYCDEKWFHCPWLISFYNFAIRTMGCMHSVGNNIRDTIEEFYNIACNNEYYGRREDANDIIRAKPFLLKVLKFGIEPFFKVSMKENFPQDIGGHEYGFGNISERDTYMNSELHKYIHRFKTNDAISLWLLQNGFDLPEGVEEPKIKKESDKREYSHWQPVNKNRKKNKTLTPIKMTVRTPKKEKNKIKSTV